MYGPVCTVVWEGEAVRPTPIPIVGIPQWAEADRLDRIPPPAASADDDVKQAIARKIIDLAKAGERNPDVLCEQALKDIRREDV